MRGEWAARAVRCAAVVLALTALVLACLPLGSGRAAAQGGHRAGLVIVHGDGRIITRCVSFDEEQITGAELLQRSGLAVQFTTHQGFGAGVCAIEGEGCAEPTDCFCHCRGTPCLYWSYWLWRDGQWVYAQQGATREPVRDGDTHGWVWGNAQSPPTAGPPGEVCAARGSAPTAMPPTAAAPAPSVPLAQYGAFAAMAALLVAALAWRARRSG